MSEIGDIMILRLPFDSKRFKTARDIAMAIQSYLAEQRVDHFFQDNRHINIGQHIWRDVPGVYEISRWQRPPNVRGEMPRLGFEERRWFSDYAVKNQKVGPHHMKNTRWPDQAIREMATVDWRRKRQSTISRAIPSTPYKSRNEPSWILGKEGISWSDNEDKTTVKSREQAIKIKNLTKELSKIK